MPAFDFLALDSHGSRRRGVTEADSEAQARQRLRDQALVPLEIRPARAGGGGARRGPRLSASERVLFTRLLGTLLASGLPLDDALTGLARQADGANFKRVALDVRARVVEGQGLAEGLAQFPATFPEIYRATVAAGSQTRHLPTVLARLADFLEARQAMQQRLKLALIYPAVLTVVAVAVVGGLLGFVVPEVVKVFEQMERELPLLTRALIATGDFARAHGLLVIVALLVVAYGLRRALLLPRVRLSVDGWILKLPLLGAFVRESDASAFARTLAILLGSGLPMLDALRIATAGVANRRTRQEGREVLERVREGAALSRALARARGFPPLLAHLVGSGEQSGDLPAMLDTSAEAHERAMEARLAVALGLAEPALILLMGAIVLVIVIAILLPIFEMNRLA